MMKNIEQHLAELEKYIVHAEKTKTTVSKVSVGWHIEHSLMVILKIAESVKKSDPNKYKWKFNFLRFLLFGLNRFPRGGGKAPSAVQPNINEVSDLKALLGQVKPALEALKKADDRQYFKHPVFGILNKKNTFKMLDIHSRHHLNIIKDII